MCGRRLEGEWSNMLGVWECGWGGDCDGDFGRGEWFRGCFESEIREEYLGRWGFEMGEGLLGGRMYFFEI